MIMKTVLKEVSYKGHSITMFKDDFDQELVIIDNDESKVYFSIADAKRVVNGRSPKYV